jgi:ribosomal protein S27AE
MTDDLAEDDGVVVERRSPEAVFALLGDDIRVGIVQALGETPDQPVAFAELRTRVGVEDSGQFNYHLKKLRGALVRRTDDGYELTYAGRQIVGAIHAGTYTASATVESIPLDGECPLCGGPLTAEYRDETAHTTCTRCEEWHNEFAFPPGSLDQFSRAELPLAFERWMFHGLHGIDAGFCHVCAGRITARLVVDSPEDRIADLPAHVEYECPRCGSTARAAALVPGLLHPAIQGFLFEHGVDVTSDPSWTFGDQLDADVTVHDTEPPTIEVRYEVTTEAGTGVITAVIDETASVTTVERETTAV